MLKSLPPTRFSPTSKEVGIVVHSSLSTYGTGSASSHPLSFQEMSKNYVNQPFTEVWDKTTFDFKTKFFGLLSATSDDVGWINTNSDGIPDTQRVYAVRIWDVASPNGAANNDTLGIANRYKPNEKSLINIYVDAITYMQQNFLTSYTLTQLVNHTIGHEVGHTVNLRHCPEVCWNNTSSCMMRPSYLTENGNNVEINIGASPSSYHYIDYDLADPVKTPQEEYTPPKKKSKASPQTGITSSLSASSGVYTAAPGDSHTANFSTGSVYSSVYWYVKSPSDTSSLGTTIEIDQGDGSLTTASFTYTFPSDVSGDYKITAYVYDSSSSVYEESYTVTVSSSTTPATPTYSLVSSDGSYTGTVTGAHTANFSTSSPYSMVYWYVKTPSDTDYYGFNQQIDYGDGSKTTASYTYQFASAGYYKFTAYVYSGSGSVYETSYWVSISLPGTPNTGIMEIQGAVARLR